MFVLDTDTVSHTQYAGSATGRRVASRIATASEPVAVTMVTFAEQMRGRLASCAAARTPEEYIEGLAQLRRLVESYRERMILDFDDAAAAAFKKLKAAKIRVGTMDLRIASIALVRDATVVTANVSDFRRVPGLKVEDWTAA